MNNQNVKNDNKYIFNNKLKEAKTISIYDHYEFEHIVDVLNECFGKNYQAWMRGGYDLDKEKKIGVWFPKMAIIKNGRAQKQGNSNKWINTMSEDGKTIRMYSSCDKNTGMSESGTHITFAKFPGKSYRYVGTFVTDSSASTPNDIILRRVSDTVDLTRWR